MSHKTAPNTALLAVRHQKLQRLLPKLKIPTAAAEDKDPAAAAAVWAACVDLLRGKCRGNEAVLRENISYGWRRNTWAIKTAGIVAAIMCTAIVGAQVGGSLYRRETIDPLVSVITAEPLAAPAKGATRTLSAITQAGAPGKVTGGK